MTRARGTEQQRQRGQALKRKKRDDNAIDYKGYNNNRWAIGDVRLETR